MVFFVCEGCNESLKKNQVDKHARQCRKCAAVTCVDCSVTFYGDDYAAHISCVSEAEKYEKSLYKAKLGSDKLKPQDIWIALIENIESYSDKASTTVRPFLSRLAALNNVPRNKKKFQNFAKNSMNIRSDHILEEIWNFVESIRQQNEAATATQAALSLSSKATTTPNVEDIEEKNEEVVEVSAEEKLKKQRKKEKNEKKKKRKLAEETEDTDDVTVEAEAISKKSKIESTITTSDAEEEKDETANEKSKKNKKDKKKRNKQEH